MQGLPVRRSWNGILHHFLTSCEAYSSLRENFLNDLESDPTNETDLNEHSLDNEISW